MAQTLIEKILSRKAGRDVRPGDIITVKADYVMLDDLSLIHI